MVDNLTEQEVHQLTTRLMTRQEKRMLKFLKIKRTNLQESYSTENDWLIFCDDGSTWVTNSAGIPVAMGVDKQAYYSKTEIDSLLETKIGAIAKQLDTINGEEI